MAACPSSTHMLLNEQRALCVFELLADDFAAAL
jgi:hypothetical protein